MTTRKPTIAIVPGTACGGCDMSIVNLHEKLLDIVENYELVYWPTAADFKLEDLKKLEKIDVVIFQGSLRLEEHVHVLKLLREKAKVLIGYGSCAITGGMYGLSNLYTRDELLKTVYDESPSTVKNGNSYPGEQIKWNGENVGISPLTRWVEPPAEIVEFDLMVGGCPPFGKTLDVVHDVLVNFAKKGVLPPRGTIVAGEKTLCDNCTREKPEKLVIREIKRIHEVELDPNKCFLSQGILCLGPITTAMCSKACLEANMPCRGCYPVQEGVHDRALKYMSALASLVEVDREKQYSDEELYDLMSKIPDPVGTFNKFSLADGLINRKQEDLKQ